MAPARWPGSCQACGAVHHHDVARWGLWQSLGVLAPANPVVWSIFMRSLQQGRQRVLARDRKLAICVGVCELRGQGVGLLVGLDDVRLPAVPRLPPLHACAVSWFSHQHPPPSGQQAGCPYLRGTLSCRSLRCALGLEQSVHAQCALHILLHVSWRMHAITSAQGATGTGAAVDCKHHALNMVPQEVGQ